MVEDDEPRAWLNSSFHQGHELVARRELIRTRTGRESEAAFTVRLLEQGGRVKNLKNPEGNINLIVPADARRYLSFEASEMTR